MGMVDAQGMLLGGDIVPEHQVQLVVAAAAAGDGGDGAVGHAVGLGEDKGRLVGIAAPSGKDLIGQLHQPVLVGAVQPDDAHGPLDDAGLDILEPGEGQLLLHRGELHGEGVVAALEVLVAQDRAADDGQVGVGAHKVVGEQGHEVQQLGKGRLVDDHGGMGGVEDDAVLVVVDVGAVLEEPVGAGHGDGDDPVVLPGGMVHPAGVALILGAELALGIARLGRGLGGGDGLGVLLGLGEVDGDIQVAVVGLGLPPQILFDPVAADVIGILGQGIIPIGGLLGAGGIEGGELGPDLPGQGREDAHELGIKEVLGGDVVVADAPGHGVVQQAGEDILQLQGRGLLILVAVEAHGHQQLVGDIGLVTGLNQALLQAVADQRRDISIDSHGHILLSIETNAAFGADGQHMAGPLTQDSLDAGAEMLQLLQGDKGLDRPGEAAAVDAVGAAALQQKVA